MNEKLDELIKELETIQAESVRFSRPVYSQGKAQPSIAMMLQSVIVRLKALEIKEPVNASKK